MRLVIDSNRIIAALIKNGPTRKIILSMNIEFCSPDHVIEEIRKHRAYIAKKSQLSEKEVEWLFALLMENVQIIPDEKVRQKMREAMQIMKNIDQDDAPILACALAIPNEGIWTEDRHFDRQTKVKIWRTADVLDA